MDKIENFFWGSIYASLFSKPLFFYTSFRHLLKYLCGIDLKPKEMKLILKGHSFYFKEFTGEIGMFNQIFVKHIYGCQQGFHNVENNHGIIMDVGANIGMFTIDIAHANPNCIIYSFEPNPDVFSRLTKNVNLNKLENVKCYNIGFSDKVSDGYLDDSISTVLGRVSVDVSSADKKKVVLSTLDSFILQNEIVNIDLLKIDVEGFEYLVLRGLKDHLCRVDKIVMECDEALKADVVSHLNAYNFELVRALPKYSVLYFRRTEHRH